MHPEIVGGVWDSLVAGGGCRKHSQGSGSVGV